METKKYGYLFSFQVRKDVVATTKKIEFMAVDVVAKEAMKITHKPMTMPTLRRIRVYQVLHL